MLLIHTLCFFNPMQSCQFETSWRYTARSVSSIGVALFFSSCKVRVDFHRLLSLSRTCIHSFCFLAFPGFSLNLNNHYSLFSSWLRSSNLDIILISESHPKHNYLYPVSIKIHCRMVTKTQHPLFYRLFLRFLSQPMAGTIDSFFHYLWRKVKPAPAPPLKLKIFLNVWGPSILPAILGLSPLFAFSPNL